MAKECYSRVSCSLNFSLQVVLVTPGVPFSLLNTFCYAVVVSVYYNYRNMCIKRLVIWFLQPTCVIILNPRGGDLYCIILPVWPSVIRHVDKDSVGCWCHVFNKMLRESRMPLLTCLIKVNLRSIDGLYSVCQWLILLKWHIPPNIINK